MAEPGSRGDARVSLIAASGRRYEFTLELAGRRHEIWFEASVPLVDSPEAAAAMSLLPAMTGADRLLIDRPLDRRLLERLPDVQAILRSWGWKWDYARGKPELIEVVCPVANPQAASPGPGEALFFSGGVDSLEAALASPSVTHLVFVAGFDLFIEDPDLDAVRAHIDGMARSLGKELITVDTNLKHLADDTGPWLPYVGSAMAGVALLLAGTVSRVRVASSVPYAALRPNGSHPLLDHLWSTEAVEILHTRAHFTRTQKLARIADDPTARSALRVCWQGPTAALNCGRCEKCLRTMVALEAHGKREAFTSFPPDLNPNAVAAVESLSPELRDPWRELLDLVRQNGCDRRLVDAVEAVVKRMPRPDLTAGSAPSSAGLDATMCRVLAGAIEDLETTREELQRSRQEVAELGAIVGDQNRALERVLESTSWQVTAPLRRGVAGARRIARRNQSS